MIKKNACLKTICSAHEGLQLPEPITPLIAVSFVSVVFVSLSQFNDEKRLMSFHQNLEDVTEDQLSLASIHYMRSHYQEAIDIYKRLLLQNRSVPFLPFQSLKFVSHSCCTSAHLRNPLKGGSLLMERY